MSPSHLTLRLSRELARALARSAKVRGLPKSEIVREAVARYLAAGARDEPGARVSARELAARWPSLPHLTADEASALARDIAASRGSLPPPRAPWE
jgi:predicted transcriptional regulator